MLTKQQQKIFDIIKEYVNKEKISPSIREICELSGLSSTASVHACLKRLEKKGYIYKLDKCPRSIRIAETNY